MRNEKSSKSTHPSDDQENPPDVQQLTPNPKLPWCPKCKRHSDYHLKVVTVHKRRGSHSYSYEKTASMYTCDECGGNTWKPQSPLFLNLFCVILFGSMLITCLYVMAKEGLPVDPPSWLLLLIIAILGYIFYRICLMNQNHWKEFWVWAQSKSYPRK